MIMKAISSQTVIPSQSQAGRSGFPSQGQGYPVHHQLLMCQSSQGQASRQPDRFARQLSNAAHYDSRLMAAPRGHAASTSFFLYLMRLTTVIFSASGTCAAGSTQ